MLQLCVTRFPIVACFAFVKILSIALCYKFLSIALCYKFLFIALSIIACFASVVISIIQYRGAIHNTVRETEIDGLKSRGIQ